MHPSPVWLFDLDNTLHDTSAAIAPEVSRRMTAYIERRFNLSRDEADRLRAQLWTRYGATLQGLVRLYGIEPGEFLHEVHDLDDFDRLVRSARGVLHALKKLPGRKILFTNGPRAYAQKLLFHLGIEAQFHRQYMIEDMVMHGRLRAKPSRSFLAHLCARERIDPRRCIFVEDSLPNLKSGRYLRIKAVLVTGMSFRRRLIARPHYVGLKVKSAAHLPRAIARLR
ncbi:MAG TPA: pyrimidine 5'-nucleotidase [Burkholderiaceae bacterium]|nr:pyrimidine 5'-nucleotidase [Burkholderiaceae bacterium]